MKPARIGIIGTGFIAVGLCLLLRSFNDMAVSRVLTRRSINSVSNIDPSLLTQSLDDVLTNSDIIVECSGDIIQASKVVDEALKAGLPVITMGSEFHVTVGSYFCQQGYLTEAQGDQPGSLAALHEEAVQMGFKPCVYGNIKGFLNHHPLPDEMAYWAKQNGISIPQVTSFTDGTKLQIEQALIANGLGAGIVQRGMLGLCDVTLADAGIMLGHEAKISGGAISDYVLNRNLPAGVFVVAEHPDAQPEVLRYLKLGDGPYYTLLRPYHLCHLEIPQTIRRVMAGKPVLLNNSAEPQVNVISIAKRNMPAGHVIETAIGGWDFRGEVANRAEFPDAPPIGLLTGARLRTSVVQGQVLSLSDVDIPDSLAKYAWESVHRHAMAES
ncbi:MAG: hypothetical protein RL693_2249 [Verrucomicrobiota bacterium]